MFIPDQSVPVEKEDESPGQESREVLGQEVVGDLPPGQLPHHRQGQGEGGVEVTSRDSTTDQESQEYSNGPTTSNINQPRHRQMENIHLTLLSYLRSYHSTV